MARNSLYTDPLIVQEIFHEVTLRASAQQVFLALTKSLQIDDWGGGPARVQAKLNGHYSLWDGEMYGIIKEFNEPYRLVHSLRESAWESNCLDSLVSWELEESDGRTVLRLTHTGLPNKKIRELHNEGWCEYFLGPMKAWIEKQ